MSSWDQIAYTQLLVGPFNGPDDPDYAMTWVDASGYLLTIERGQPLSTSSGRQTDLQAVSSGPLTATLLNTDGRFTSGNPVSPYYPGWRTGMRVRYQETIGSRTFVIFDGNMLQPEATVRAAGIDQTVTLNAVDRIGRLATGRTFVSTLAEYIRANGGTDLGPYYPLGEVGGVTFPNRAATTWPSASLVEVTSGYPTGVGAMYALGGGSALPGDDIRPLSLTPLLDTSNNARLWTKLYGWLGNNGVITGPSGTFSLAAWVTLNDVTADNLTVMSAVCVSGLSIALQRVSGAWQLNVTTGGGLSLPVTGPAPGMPMLLAVRVNIGSGLCEFWRHTDPVVSGSITAPGSGQQWTSVSLGTPMNGTLGHVQVYAASTAYTRTAHLAQITAGQVGLYGQRVGQRIRTLAGYAGMGTADLDIDDGVAVLQNASLAGKSPLAAMQAAADTDLGLLHARGRTLVFHSRKRRYDQ